MIHAYARVSTSEQDPRFQLEALARAGADKVWQERRSAVSARPELDAMLEALLPGDVVVVWKLDRLARSLRHLLAILDRVASSGASLRSCTEPLDTGSPMGRMMIQILGSFSEFERGIILERSAAGVACARARGVQFGRKRVVDRSRVQVLLNAGLHQSAIAREIGCSRASICRLISQGHVSKPDFSG